MFPAPRSFSPTEHRVVAVARWMLAVGVPVLALWSTTAYHAVWQSTRSVAAMLAPVMVWSLAAGRIADVGHRQFVFASLAVLAWASLCQYPFAAPIYFCYVFPLAVVGAVMLFAATGWIQRPGLKPWAGMLLVFPILAMHPSWLVNVGQRFQRRVFDRPLGVARATLIVTPADADKYSRLTRLVSERLRAGRLLAGPDCPEVYFLTGQLSPVGVSYDFFSDRSTFDPALWPSADVVVINRSPRFSTPLAPELVAAIRREFGQSELLGEFEVRWR
jgi:hypothetical protein